MGVGERERGRTPGNRVGDTKLATNHGQSGGDDGTAAKESPVSSVSGIASQQDSLKRRQERLQGEAPISFPILAPRTFETRLTPTHIPPKMMKRSLRIGVSVTRTPSGIASSSSSSSSAVVGKLNAEALASGLPKALAMADSAAAV